MICTQVIPRGGQLRFRSAWHCVCSHLEPGKEYRNNEQQARLFTPTVRFFGHLYRRGFLLADRTGPLHRSCNSQQWNT